MPDGSPRSVTRTWTSNTKEPVERQVYLLLQHISGELIYELSSLLKPAGITPEQYQVLRILNETRAGGVPLNQIAERSPAGDPDITRLIDRLEERSLAKRERDTVDRRVIIARITTDGRRLVGKLEKQVEALHERQLAALGNQGLTELKKLLQRVARGAPAI